MKKKCWGYHQFTHVHQKPQSYDVCYLRQRVRQTECFVILGLFLPFYLTNNPVNQNFEEMKTLEDIIILHKCTKTENHMMYGS